MTFNKTICTKTGDPDVNKKTQPQQTELLVISMSNPNPNDSANGSAAANVDGQQIARVSVRPPPFWRENPALWFKQLESQFITNGITASDTKFHVAVSALDTAIISQVSDLVMNPPAAGKYESLKIRLQERFAESETQRFRKLLGDFDLGDKKPSHLWREMRALAGENNVTELMMKSLWMQRLPAQSQAILSAEDGNIERTITLADRIHEIFGARQINALESESPSWHQPQIKQQPKNALEQLCEQMSELTKQVSLISNGSHSHRSRSKSQSGIRAENTSARGKSPQPFCWYHHRYGKNARKCIKPCEFGDASPEN